MDSTKMLTKENNVKVNIKIFFAGKEKINNLLYMEGKCKFSEFRSFSNFSFTIIHITINTSESVLSGKGNNDSGILFLN